MRIPLFQVDAFTNRLFAGNPAAVCPLDRWLPTETMQAIAAENNLSETAFFVREGEGYRLRWFTPTTEVELCGHATLASAFVIWNCLNRGDESLRFSTRSGMLSVARRGPLLVLDFPSRRVQRCSDPPRALADGLGIPPIEMWTDGEAEQSGFYLAVYPSESMVRSLEPDLRTLRIPGMGVVATAPGDEADCASRCFAPSFGIDEDPVTGSIHCFLAPYWAERLGKRTIRAHQVSQRGGELICELAGDRVHIAGHAVLYMEGWIDGVG
jgi:PhzF family phenazine biosynthesis protein